MKKYFDSVNGGLSHRYFINHNIFCNMGFFLKKLSLLALLSSKMITVHDSNLYMLHLAAKCLYMLYVTAAFLFVPFLSKFRMGS